MQTEPVVWPGTAGRAAVAVTPAQAATTRRRANPTKAPSEDACVIADKYGVFVSPTGNDITGDGSMSAPYATLGKGFVKAKTSGKRVYACADGGDFTESPPSECHSTAWRSSAV